MLEELTVHGFRTLVDTKVSFDPLTIMIGKNGAGKTSILDVLQLIRNFARGGTERAFGPPPWSLGWQRTKGIGSIHAVRFDVNLRVSPEDKYHYSLALDERQGEPQVKEERVTRLRDHNTLASFNFSHPPRSGTILNPDDDSAESDELHQIARIFRSVVSYELNPSAIEQGNEPEQTFIGRNGFGVAGYLAHLQDSEPDRFGRLQQRLQEFRPETNAIEVWVGGKALYWGIRDSGQKRAFPAVHLSWGDRQLVGLLCVLYSTKPGSTIAIEEIDRGFHPSRYDRVIEILSETAYAGLDGAEKMQIVVTTHSPSFINRLQERLSEIRMVTRAPAGSTIVKSLRELIKEKLGTEEPEQPLGEIWEMGLLDDIMQEALK